MVTDGDCCGHIFQVVVWMQFQRSNHMVVRSFCHPCVQDDFQTRSTLHVKGSNGGIEYWYASPYDTFIWMFSAEKPLHVLPKFSLDVLVMQEVAYHISTGLTARLQRKKKAPWPTLPLWIGLYEIQSIKQADVEAELMKKYPFDLRSYNLYDPHWIVKDHCMRVQFN